MNQENIGKKIAFFRKQLNLTQEQLGEKLCVSSKTISKWERGVSLPDILSIPKICDVLGIGVDELLVNNKNISNTLDIDKKSKFNKPFFKKVIFLLSLLIFIFSFIISHYNCLHIFNISSDTEDFIVNGYAILNHKKNIIILDNIKCLVKNSEKYDKIKIIKIEFEIDKTNKIILYYNNINANSETIILDDDLNDVAIYVDDFKYNYLLNGDIKKVNLKSST